MTTLLFKSCIRVDVDAKAATLKPEIRLVTWIVVDENLRALESERTDQVTFGIVGR